MDEENQTSLADLLPTSNRAVMDLVSEAGIDVSPWKVKKDGSPVKRPKANPHYCYKWAYGPENGVLLLCVWHDILKEAQISGRPAIICQDNMRDLVQRLDQIADDQSRPRGERDRVRDQARRGRAFDELIQLAKADNLTIRLIINRGTRGGLTNLGKNASKVKVRMLDSANWYAHDYIETTGQYLLVREIPDPSAVSGSAGSAHAAPPFVDQFSTPEPAARREVTVTVSDRSSAVRANALARANGVCELCGRGGFRTIAGSIYLETHHVTPLADGGLDHESNVVAICPEDHRKAHYAADKAEIKAQLLTVLQQTQTK